MTPQNPTDADLIAAIQGTREAREKALQTLFQTGIWQQIVVRYVQQHGGSEQDGKDVFQDTMILFDRNIRSNTFEGRASLQTYFVGIAKWRWLAVQRQRKNLVELDTAEHIKEAVQSPENQMISDEKRLLFDESLAQLGKRCQALLGLVRLEYSMKEIADALELSSPEMAKKNAYECRMKFRAYLEKHPKLLKILRG
jgi:RNA polymerase sigma factor (sigma-70 family)